LLPAVAQLPAKQVLYIAKKNRNIDGPGDSGYNKQYNAIEHSIYIANGKA